MKLLKWLLWLVVIVIALAATAAVAVTLLVDMNDYKPQIEQLVGDQTGRQLSLDGDIELSVFPWLGAAINRASLANGAGFSDAPMVAVDRAEVRIKLLPLIGKNVEADTVILHGLTLNLERDAAGRGNWEDLLQADDGQPATGGGDGEGLAVNELALDGLDLRAAAVHWNDRAAGRQLAITDLNLETGEIRPGQPFAVTANAALAAPDNGVNATLRLSGELNADLAAERFTATGLTFEATASGTAVPGGQLPLRLTADAAYDAAAAGFQVTGLTLDAAGLSAAGSVTGSGLDQTPSVAGTLTLAGFSPRELLQKLGQTPPSTADPAALTQVSGEFGFSATPTAVTVDKLALRLDDSSLNGSLRAPLPGTLQFDLALDAIDLDRYLPPRQPGEPPPVETPGSRTAKTAAEGSLPLEPLRALDLDGRFSIDRLKVNKLKLSDIELPLTAAAGKLTLRPKASLYDGAYQGNIGIDVTQNVPLISLNETLRGVQAGPLLLDLTDNERISGRADAEAQLTLRGADPDTVKRTLNGSARFAFSDGAVKGINIGQLIRQAKAQLSGTALDDADGPVQTDFSELLASVKIANGVLSNDDLSAKSPLLRVSGEGQADLPADQVDYRLTVALVDTSQGQGGKELAELRGIPIPIKISGPLTDPSIGLDLAAVLQQQTEAVVQQKADELAAKAKEKIGKELENTLGDQVGKQLGEQAGEALKGEAGKLLKGLFGN